MSIFIACLNTNLQLYASKQIIIGSYTSITILLYSVITSSIFMYYTHVPLSIAYYIVLV